MTTELTLRTATPADGPAMGQLKSIPDTGQIKFSIQYHVDFYHLLQTTKSDVTGVIAEAPGIAHPAGMGVVDFTQRYYEGQLRPCALLSHLIVHPDFRRQGLATKLALWRVNHARERFGEDVVLFACIQKGNTGSEVNAHKWCQQLAGNIVAGVTAMRTKPPTPNPAITIRPAQENELAPIAEQQNAFYADYNLYEPHTAETLACWLAKTAVDKPMHHYWVATDAAGNILAGIGVVEEFKVEALQVEKLPTLMRLANNVVKLIPPDGTMREILVEHVWYAPGQLAAARDLFEVMCWEWHDQGNMVRFNYDARSSLKDVFRVPFWQPQTAVSVAVTGPTPMSAGRLIYPYGL